MAYKIIFFDIDWTLYDHNINGVPLSTQRAIQQVYAQGILIIFCSGRSYHLMRELGVIDSLPHHGVITCNGSLVMDQQKNVIYEEPFPSSEMERLIALCNREGICLNLVEKERHYLTRNPDDFVIDSCRTLHITPPQKGTYTGAPLYQGLIFFTEEQQNRLNSELHGYHILRFHPQACDVALPNVNKAKGIAAYLEYLNLRPEEAMAFGDGGNDVEMLQFVGLGIAMGNASDSVKKAADYVTTGIDQDGVANALIHFGIIPNL